MNSVSQRTTLFIGIGGGSASGKTTLAKLISELTGALCISLDNFYLKDLETRENPNWDNPESFDWEEIHQMMIAFRLGLSRRLTIHDHAEFKTLDGEFVDPTAVVIIEGIHAFSNAKINDMYGLKVFVDCNADTRLARRIVRDIQERGRDVETTIKMYESQVRPAFELYIEPTRMKADIIIPNNRKFEDNSGVEMIVRHVREKMMFDC